MTVQQFYQMLQKVSDLSETRIETLHKIVGGDCTRRGRGELMVEILAEEFLDVATAAEGSLT